MPPDPADARRRALADPSPHPDLVWLRPPGIQHLVETVRERVIAQVAYRPFEGDRRVFVIEAAEAMAEESQNALLKTLEEPPPFAHLILITAEPEALLETVRSRCQEVRFARLGPDAVEARLEEQGEPAERRAAARLCDGDVGPRRLPARARGARAARRGRGPRPRRCGPARSPGRRGRRSPSAADAAGEREAATVREARRARRGGRGRAQRPGRAPPPARRRGSGRSAPRGARATRPSTSASAWSRAWMRDLVAVAERAPELVLNSDREPELAELAAGLDPRRARRAGELVMETRRRLTVNVSETLALEALAFRVEYLLSR